MGQAKKHIAQNVSDLAGIPLPKAIEVVNIVLKSMAAALQRKEKVEIRGFGRFFVRYTKPYRTHIHIGYTSSLWLIPGKNKVVFRPAKEFKLMVNTPEAEQCP